MSLRLAQLYAHGLMMFSLSSLQICNPVDFVKQNFLPQSQLLKWFQKICTGNHSICLRFFKGVVCNFYSPLLPNCKCFSANDLTLSLLMLLIPHELPFKKKGQSWEALYLLGVELISSNFFFFLITVTLFYE